MSLNSTLVQFKQKNKIDVKGLIRALVSIPLWFNSNAINGVTVINFNKRRLNSTLVQFKLADEQRRHI